LTADSVHAASCFAVAAAVLVLFGCRPDDSRCREGPQPGIEIANRMDEQPISDGAAVEVFPPPQGGVFTELDVTVVDISPDDLDQMRVTIDVEGAISRADQAYAGALLPWVCREPTGAFLDNMPVAFDADAELERLDGLSAHIVALASLGGGAEARVEYDVTLAVTQY
jgi:hypothetical protein